MGIVLVFFWLDPASSARYNASAALGGKTWKRLDPTTCTKRLSYGSRWRGVNVSDGPIQRLQRYCSAAPRGPWTGCGRVGQAAAREGA